MIILILGGTGAIGNQLVNTLASDNTNRIYVTSRSTRSSNFHNVHYITGNAKDNSFLDNTLNNNHYDVIVDFMSYKTAEFQSRYSILLDATDQYVFLSSSRVYANSTEPITEESPVLLNTIDDETYIRTDEYALAKARQEDLLNKSGRKNFTIIRPYITYSNDRLQLGILEKEMWLYRALRGHSIVFGEDEAQMTTTLTYGGDVANGIAAVIGNETSYGETYQIMQAQTITWKEVLELYCGIIMRKTGYSPSIVWCKKSTGISTITGKTYQHLYDRMYNRIFDNSKIKRVFSGMNTAVSPRNGLEKCLAEFINSKHSWRNIDWKFEGWADKISAERTSFKEIPGLKNKIKYYIARNTNFFEIK